MNAKTPTLLIGNKSLRVTLDGESVPVPAERRSISAIRCYLETLALERQRVLFIFTVDDEPAELSDDNRQDFSGVRVEAESVDLTEMPLRLIETALQQTAAARREVETAISVVLINAGRPAQEIWWDLTRKLKDPLLTLCLLPEGLFGPLNGAASPMQLRRWQLQQLAAILRDVDRVCWTPDPVGLSNALENLVLPWLEALHQSISLLHDTSLAGVRAAAARTASVGAVAH